MESLLGPDVEGPGDRNGHLAGRDVHRSGGDSGLREAGADARGGAAVRRSDERYDTLVPVPGRCEPYPAASVGGMDPGNEGICAAGGESIAYFDADAAFHRGCNGRRIEHLRALGCQRQRVLVGHFRDGPRRYHRLGVRGHKSGNVCPYLEGIGLDCRRVDCRAEIGAAAAEGCDAAFGSSRYEAGSDEDPDRAVLSGGLDVSHRGIVVMGDNQLPGVEPPRIVAFKGEFPGDNPCGKEFAVGYGFLFRGRQHLPEKLQEFLLRGKAFLSGEKAADDGEMAGFDFTCGVRGAFGYCNQSIRTAADC